jgi:thiamine-phosphate pyrophosphorylase
MASRSQTPDPPREPTRLYLVTPVEADAARLAQDLAGMLEAADVAAVLLRLGAADERTLINLAKVLTPVVQAKEVALLLDGYPDLVARAGADGAHLTGIDAFEAALPALKPARIAGVGGLATRHDAMQAAESGADYLMFGEPGPDGTRPPFAAVEERIAWWAEVFETPCVAYAASLEEIAPLVAAGADFVAVGDWIWQDARGPVAAVADAAHRLGSESVP